MLDRRNLLCGHPGTAEMATAVTQGHTGSFGDRDLHSCATLECGAAGGRVPRSPRLMPLRRAGFRSPEENIGSSLQESVDLLRDHFCGLSDRLLRHVLASMRGV